MKALKIEEFSTEVEKRAKDLYELLDFNSHKHKKILAAIENSSLSRMILEDFTTYGFPKLKVDRAIQSARTHEAVLTQNGITDDASAIAFLDKVEPEIKQWDQEWQCLLTRQEEERKIYLSGLK